MDAVDALDREGNAGEPVETPRAGSSVAGQGAKAGQRRRTRSLVMWSGGLDSTYALARLLRDSDNDVYAHHIHLNALREDDGKSRSRRCEYEAQAVSQMLVPLKSSFGAFEYSESRADLTAFSSFARDSATAMYFAAQLAMSRRFTPFDRIVLGVNDSDPRWRSGTELYAYRRSLLNRILRAVWESEEVPYLYVMDPRPSKIGAMEYLGAELAMLTVSCRYPKSGVSFGEDDMRSCGTCPKCQSRPEFPPRLSADAAA